MKQRITYIVPNPDEFNPELLEVKGDSMSLSKVKAAKEHRVTFGLSELPQEISKAFEQLHEFHLKWSSNEPYESVTPFTSRVSPGLHIFYTPSKDHPDANFCPLFKEIIGDDLPCENPKESSIQLPVLSERFSMSASNELYFHLPKLSGLIQFFQFLCPMSPPACKVETTKLHSASYLDIDYDAISHAVVLTAFWAKSPDAAGWTETIKLPGQADPIEIGVLNREANPDPEDIQYAGFLTVLGQDKKPKPTLFQAPSRHYPLPSPNINNLPPQTYTTTFNQPTGLHPTLHLHITNPSPPDPTCKLHTHLTLPSHLFIDKYQFTDPLALQSHNLTSLRSIAGATDLEAPDWVVQQWGSAALFEISIPKSPSHSSNVDVTIPLHARYLPASSTSSHTRLPLPWPVAFWACAAEDGTKFAVNPFDRVNLGYEGLFGARTKFVHLSP
ncbi:PIG-X-domain-containing protein, partial [Aaosphaeria arxii CBS 175.79]